MEYAQTLNYVNYVNTTSAPMCIRDMTLYHNFALLSETNQFVPLPSVIDKYQPLRTYIYIYLCFMFTEWQPTDRLGECE